MGQSPRIYLILILTTLTVNCDVVAMKKMTKTWTQYTTFLLHQKLMIPKRLAGLRRYVAKIGH